MFRLLVVLFCVLGVACVGCGDGLPTGKVTGVVTMDGDPLESALVTFSPAEGGMNSTGITDENGEYTMTYIAGGGGEGALLGTNTVTVTTFTPPVESNAAEISSDSPEYAAQMSGSSSDYDMAASAETIPAEYNSATTLTCDVEKGKNSG